MFSGEPCAADTIEHCLDGIAPFSVNRQQRGWETAVKGLNKDFALEPLKISASKQACEISTRADTQHVRQHI